MDLRFVSQRLAKIEHVECSLPQFMQFGAEHLEAGMSTEDILLWLERPTTIVVNGNRKTYIWQHSACVKSHSGDGLWDWKRSSRLYYHATILHFEDDKQVGPPEVVERPVSG